MAACCEVHGAPIRTGDPDPVITGGVSPIEIRTYDMNPWLGRHSPARRNDHSDRSPVWQVIQVLRPDCSRGAGDDGAVTSPHPGRADHSPYEQLRFHARCVVLCQIDRGQDAAPAPLSEVSINHSALQTGRQCLIPADQLILATNDFGQGELPGQLDHCLHRCMGSGPDARRRAGTADVDIALVVWIRVD